ncbi:MAG: hypothetical protein MUO40_02135 [Anaerolineaceae bacterium]|nr:hypothetical protein [Anaerolineaceae bacterium]
MHIENKQFTESLYKKMQEVNPGIAEMELFEFCYCLETILPTNGWENLHLPDRTAIEEKVNDSKFYASIQLRPKLNGKPIMDEQVLILTQQLLAGLVTGNYEPAWINQHFSFDIRGFYFIHKTQYYTKNIKDHLGGKPYKQFENKQAGFAGCQSVGYKEFKEANSEVDGCLIDLVRKLVNNLGTPILIAIAGQTGAGKTEIVERMVSSPMNCNKNVTSLEIDNFLLDRDYREAKGIDSLGKEALHYEFLKQSLVEINQGKKITIPCYDFIKATSSHDLNGDLKPGCQELTLEPADIIFMEGNFPFLLPEIADQIRIKVMYLTDDAVRMQRKWKRDMDYRKKYNLMYFLNRYFREQFLMAESVYLPQSLQCDVFVDTTGAAVWVTPELQTLLKE